MNSVNIWTTLDKYSRMGSKEGFLLTEKSILEFDFSLIREGEIHGLALVPTDVEPSEIKKNIRRMIVLSGTQKKSRKAITDFVYTRNKGEFQHYAIEIGKFFKPGFYKMVLINDHDVSAPRAKSVFRNMALYEFVDPMMLNVYRNPEEDSVEGLVDAVEKYIYNNRERVEDNDSYFFNASEDDISTIARGIAYYMLGGYDGSNNSFSSNFGGMDGGNFIFDPVHQDSEEISGLHILALISICSTTSWIEEEADLIRDGKLTKTDFSYGGVTKEEYLGLILF